MSMTLLRGGRVIDPASGTDGVMDVAIDGGAIAEIGPKLPAPEGCEVVECDGLLVTPGLIDPHVHLREPGQEHKETIATGTLAAARGGFTTVVCMPNTTPPIDSPEIVRFVADRAMHEGSCRVFCAAAASVGRKGERLTEFALLAKAGAAAFTDDGDVIASAGLMTQALRAARHVDRPLMQHCQEPSMTRGASMHAGEVSTRLGLGGWPRAAEEVIVERDIRLNREIGAKYHIQHVSSAGSVQIVRRARADAALGERVTCEATPHHLLLTHHACEGFDTRAKMNPPLREDADAKAIVEGVADGTITILGTDHAPHTAEEKSRDFESAPFGIVGIETALALYRQALVEAGAIDWPRLIGLMTWNPARLCGLDGLGLGRLAPGGPADVTVIDAEAAWTINSSAFASIGRSTPFEGWHVRGAPVRVYCGGRLTHLSGLGAGAPA